IVECAHGRPEQRGKHACQAGAYVARAFSLSRPNNFRSTGSSIAPDPFLEVNVCCFFGGSAVLALRLTFFRDIALSRNESVVSALSTKESSEQHRKNNPSISCNLSGWPIFYANYPSNCFDGLTRR